MDAADRSPAPFGIQHPPGFVHGHVDRHRVAQTSGLQAGKAVGKRFRHQENQGRRGQAKLRSRHGLSDDGIADLIDCLAFQADLVEPAAHWDAQLTDPFDQAILGTLVAAQANYLITGDKALLALADKYPVLAATQFWQMHGAA